MSNEFGDALASDLHDVRSSWGWRSFCIIANLTATFTTVMMIGWLLPRWAGRLSQGVVSTGPHPAKLPFAHPRTA
jgi:hypothetical protein